MAESNRNKRIMPTGDGQSSKDRRSGFTLIELMVVIGLILMITGFAIVGFRGGEARRMEAALRTVHGQLNYARQFAITQRSQAVVVIPVDGAGEEHNLRAFFVATGVDSLITNAITGWVTLPQGVYFDPNPAEEDTIFAAGSPPGVTWPPDLLPAGANVRVLRFGPRGELLGVSGDRRVYLAEGVLVGNSITRFNDDLWDLILVRRLTGLAEIHRLQRP